MTAVFQRRTGSVRRQARRRAVRPPRSGPCANLRRSFPASNARPCRLARRLSEVINAYPYSRHLRHLHGFARGAGQGTRPSRHRLRCQRLSADEHPARGSGYRADAGLRAGASGTGTRSGGGGQRHVAWQPGSGIRAEQGAALCLRPAMAGRSRVAGSLGTGGGRHPWQDHHQQHAGLGAGTCRHEPGFLIGVCRRTSASPHGSAVRRSSW